MVGVDLPFLDFLGMDMRIKVMKKGLPPSLETCTDTDGGTYEEGGHT